MRQWFRTRFGQRPVGAPALAPSDPVQAYRAGRVDERRTLAQDGTAPHADRAELDAAYERGRRDGRHSRRGSPLLAAIVLVVAVFGGLTLYLAARDGGFAAAGAAVDHTLSGAKAPFTRAADKTGDALQTAGQDLKQRAGSANDSSQN